MRARPESSIGVMLRDAVLASAVMTVSQHIEMSLTGRPPSDLPAATFERLSHRKLASGPLRVAVGHLAQGFLALGAVALAVRLRDNRSRLIPAVLGGVALVAVDAAVAGALHLGPPPWKWNRQDLATDLTHKTVLMGAATVLAR